MTQDSRAPHNPPRSPWQTLAVVCAAVFFSVLNGTMINVALPIIGRDLNIEPARLGWILTGYLLVFGVSVPFYGRLADRYGARRLFVLGLWVYAGASLLSALAGSYGTLMAARLLQACGAAAIPGLGMALVSGVYPGERRGSAMGVVSAAVGTGAAIGPTIGGLVSGRFGWNYLFLLSALAGLLIPFALKVLPFERSEGGEGLDLPGGVLLGFAIGGALLAATEGSRGDFGAPVVVGAATVSVLAGLLLALRQMTTSTPFIPRELLRNRRYLALIAISFTSMSANLATLVALPLMLTEFNRLRPEQVGLVLLPEAAVFTVLGVVAGRMVDRVGTRNPIRLGLLTMLFSLLGFSVFGAGAPAWLVGAVMVSLSAGFAFVNSPLTTSVSLIVSPQRLSSGLSINSMFFFLGGGFGAALLSAILTLREGTQNALNPVYVGRADAYSDAFLLLALPVVAALALSLALPSTRRVVEEPKSMPLPQPASSTAQR